MTSSVSRNILANILGRGWGALLAIALTPIYIKLLGIEAYGLVGIFITLQGLLPIVDMGLGMAANREAAVLAVQDGGIRKLRNLVRTLEWIYWGLAIAIVLAVAMLSDVITHHWVNSQSISPTEVRAAIFLMGAILGAQLPSSLYGGVLMGLQLQVPINVLNIGFSTVRALGAVLVIGMSPNVTSFFQWQAVISVTQMTVTGSYLWRRMRTEGHIPTFDPEMLRQIRRFAAEMSGITLMSAALMQLDKIVLSRILTLEHFGYYFAASTAAGALYLVISPVFGALFPKFSQLVGLGDEARIRVLFNQASQVMAVAVWPVMAILVFFAGDLLQLWTHNRQMAENGATILALLAFGNALNGAMNIPYALQLAAGKAGQVLKVNIILIIFFVPAVIALANTMGGVGAAIAWVTYTAAFWAANAVIAGKWFAYLDWRRWLWRGHVLPVLIALGIVAIGHWVRLARNATGWVEILLTIALTGLAALVATGASSPILLEWVRTWRAARSLQRQSGK